MNIHTYEEKYNLLQKLINSHSSLDRSFWFHFMKDDLKCCLTYQEILDQLIGNKAFKYDWNFGKFIQKVKNEIILFENFSYRSIFLPTQNEIKSSRWVVSS